MSLKQFERFGLAATLEGLVNDLGGCRTHTGALL